jgi:hypothetical protein
MFVKQFFHSSSIPDNNRRVYSTEATEKGYTQAHWERKQSSMTQDMTLAKKLEGWRCQFVWTIKVERESWRKGSNIMQMTSKVQIEVTVDKQGKQ